jgi:hypothetical protein
MRDFADRLIAYETRGNKSSETKTPAACLVGEKLRPHLAIINCSLVSVENSLLRQENSLFHCVGNLAARD